MGNLSRALPDHPIEIETVRELDDRDSVEETLIVTLVEGNRVSSFLVRTKNIHSIGFSEERRRWEKIGTFPADEVTDATRSTTEWMKEQNEMVDDPGYAVEDVDTLEEFAEAVQDQLIPDGRAAHR